jgi:predicted MFS family arabinose efflux permease
VPHPILDLRLFRNAVFAFSNLAALINYSATFAATFLLSLYLQVGRGLEPQSAGLLLLAQPLVMAVLSPFAGRLSDRVEPRRVASAGMALSCASLFLFSRLTASTPLPVVVLGLLLAGTGFALFSSPNTNAVMSAVERGAFGVASATLGTMRLVGQSLSMALVALVLARHMGAARITAASAPALLAATGASFLLFASLCLAGIFASLARGRVHGEGP